MTASVALSGAEVARVTGASYRQIDYWDRTDLIRASVSSGGGSGSKRRWSVEDAVLCRLVFMLGEAGLRTEALRGRGAGSLIREALADGSGWFVLLCGDEAIVTREPRESMAALHSTVVTLIDLDAIRRHVADAIRRPGVVSAFSASQTSPARSVAVERADGAAGPVGHREVPSGSDRTTTNEDGAGAALPDAVSVA